MIKFFKKIIWAWRYKRAVKKANDFHDLFKIKYRVLYVGGHLRVISKQDLRRMVKQGVFKKGVTVEDICRRAVYTTI